MRRYFTARGFRAIACCAAASLTLIAVEISPGNEPAQVAANAEHAVLPLLTTAATVAQLKPEDAQRAFPVKVRGVVICVVPEHRAFVLQDATRGVFIRDESEPARVGELWEVEGVTARGSFAPIIIARGKQFLGLGNLPSPVRPAWDQLMNGSLDDQLVEVQGVVESAAYDAGGWSHVILRTQGGTLRVDLPGSDINPDTLKRSEKNLVHIRGCLFAMVDPATGRVKAGQVRIYGAEITLEQPDKDDLFSIPVKTAAELMQFDPRASAFRRVKVAGQILHTRGSEHFMMDATNGVRFVSAPDELLLPGDIVEVVGFPALGGAAPVLTEAVARKTGHAELPPGTKLEADNLMSVRHDSTLVRVEAMLASVRPTETNLVMEMESGSWRFLARLNTPNSAQPPLRIGSTLELTGVYASQNRNLSPDATVVPFELLLNSPADIAVLRTPSWWTLQRLLALVGVLAGVLVLAALWITQLRRKVEERTTELAAQIRERQQAEQSQLMERERARIAQDLHDELGSGLTEISMLAARTGSLPAASEKNNGHLLQMNEKAREMVTALDEIVWAMNPAHNSLSSLVSYFSIYADRFLGLAGINWRLEDGTAAGDQMLDSHGRHQLFRAYKEALTNVVRHSGATEVRVGVQCVSNELRVVIADNGRGMSGGAASNGGSGLDGMRSRIEKLGGRFNVTTEAGRGTTVKFFVPTN